MPSRRTSTGLESITNGKVPRREPDSTTAETSAQVRQSWSAQAMNTVMALFRIPHGGKSAGIVVTVAMNNRAQPADLIRNLISDSLLLVCLTSHRVAPGRHLCRSAYWMPLKKTWWKWRWDVEGVVQRQGEERLPLEHGRVAEQADAHG
jgi:hypothetical protein